MDRIQNQLEVEFWACLGGIILIDLTDVESLSTVGGTVPWLSSWMYKWSWGGTTHAVITES